MNEIAKQETAARTASFFDRPNVEMEHIAIGPGIPLGIERVYNPEVGIGGAYGAWGNAYNNDALPGFLEDRIGQTLPDDERLSLGELGFESRHHVPHLSLAEHDALETHVGVRLLQAAIRACGWEPGEVQALLLGMTAPISLDYTERIARAAGIPENALKVSVHKACDGSVGGLNLALNPHLPAALHLPSNLAAELTGKKVLVGGIEALSRFLGPARDLQALQLFGNGAGIIGLIPGKTMKFLAGGTREAYDEEGVLQVAMAYPHSGDRNVPLEVTETGANNLRIAGLMHEPDDGSVPVKMAGPMGMVKLFVRTGVMTVHDVYQSYVRRMAELGTPSKEIAVAIAHHANYKINQIKGKHLEKEGIRLQMPWLLRDFGNVSAASNMIGFLRKLVDLHPGDNVMFDGFGAGTYYDVVTVELGQ